MSHASDGARAGDIAGGVVADFTLEDPQGAPQTVRFADAPLTLVVFTSRESAKAAEAWGRRVRGALAAAGATAARVVGVAAVGKIPGFVRPVVRRALAAQAEAQTGGEAAVLVDWDDLVAARFGYRPKTAPRAVLVDAAGRVRAAADGPASPAAVDAFAAAALMPG